MSEFTLEGRPFVNRLGIRAPALTPIKDVILSVCDRRGVTYPEIISQQRRRSIAWPRQEAMYECSKATGASLPEIGRAFGGRDHTTVLHGIRKHKERMAGANGAA